MDVEEQSRSSAPETFQNAVINTQSLPRLEGLDFEGHPKRYRRFRLMWLSIVALIFAMVPTGILVIAILENGEDIREAFIAVGVIYGLWLLIFSLFFLEEIKGFSIRGYVIRERDVTYRAGFLFRSVTTIPFNRIQHSEITQGPIARRFKLSHLKIYTAGGSGSDLKIPGLDPEEAARLRDFINEKSGKHA